MATRLQDVPQEKPQTITLNIPGYGSFELEPRMFVQLQAAVTWSQGNPLLLGQVARRAQIAASQVGEPIDESSAPTGHAQMFAEGLISREELASAGIPMSEVMKIVRDLHLRIKPQQPRPEAQPEGRVAVARAAPQVPEPPVEVQPTKAAPGLPGVPSSGTVGIPVRERGEVTPSLPTRISRADLAGQQAAQMVEVPADTVPTPATPTIPQEAPKTKLSPQEEAEFQRWYADWAQKLTLNPNPDDPQQFYDYRGAFKAGAYPTEESGWHWPSEFKLEGHPRLIVDGMDTRTGEPVQQESVGPERPENDQRILEDYRQGKITRAEAEERFKRTNLLHPDEEISRLNNIDRYGSQYIPPATTQEPEDDRRDNARAPEMMYGEPKPTARSRADLVGQAAAQGRKLPLDLLNRVSAETQLSRSDVAGLLTEGPPSLTNPVNLTFGEAVARGGYSGLRRYLQIFGADPNLPLPPGIQSSGFGEFVGEAITATPSFLVGSGVVGMTMKGAGLAARMTPLSYSLTRSALTGATLGIGRTPIRDFSFNKLTRNMAEEAAIWTAFDAGLLTIAGRMGKLAQAGREIRGIRRQIRGGEQFVDPVLLTWEDALHPNAAKDWRAVANRVHELWAANPENRFEKIVAETLGQTNAWGATVLRELDDKTLSDVVEHVRKAMPDGYSTAVHKAGPGQSSLLLLDEASLTGRSYSQRAKEVLYRFQQQGRINDDVLVEMLQRGLMDKGGLPPLEVIVSRPETGASEAVYEFTFGTTTNALGKRQIRITMPLDAGPNELASALAHELTHDMIVTSLGVNPQRMPGLLRTLFHGAPEDDLVRAGRYRGIKVEELESPKMAGRRPIGMSVDQASRTIKWNEEGLQAAWKRFQSGKTLVAGVYRPQNIHTYEQFKRFAFEHERQHLLNPRQLAGESKLEFESRINRATEQALANRRIKGGEQAWLRELREIQRTLHSEKLGSRKAAIDKIRKEGLANDEFELLADFIEFVTASPKNLGRAYFKAPKSTERILDWARQESLVMKSILDQETIATEAILREYADLLGSNAEEIMKGATKIRGRRTSLRKMAVEQRVSAQEALAQFEREGAYNGQRVFLEGRLMEVEARFPKEGRVRVRDVERVKGRYKTLEVDDVRLQYPTVQGNIRYFETAVNIVNNILKSGPPRTLGVFVRDGRGGVGRAIFRTKDLLYFKGTRGEFLDSITKEMGTDFVKGLNDTEVFLRYAKTKGLKGAMVDEDLMLTIFGDPTEAAIHYHDMAPELVKRVHGSMATKEFQLTAEDVLAEGLYQAGIPAREVENMAEFAMNLRSFQLKDLIDEDFAPHALDDLWQDILADVHFFNDGGARAMRHGSGRVTVLPNGQYAITINEGAIPGGQIAALVNSAEEAAVYVARMSPSPAAPNLSLGSPIPNAMGAGLNPKGGAPPLRFGETAESAMRPAGLDLANDIDRTRWEVGLNVSERLGEAAKRLGTLVTSSRTLFQEYEKRGMGPVFTDIWTLTQDRMNAIKVRMNAENPVFGMRKSGKAHSAISGTREYQRRIQKLVPGPRRHLLTKLQQALNEEELAQLANFNQETKNLITILDTWAKRGVDMRLKVPKLTGNMDAAHRYLSDPVRFMGMMEAELRGTVPTENRNLARHMMAFRSDPSKITVKDILVGMGHTEEEATLMEAVTQRMAKGQEIDLFGISRHYSANMTRKEFIAANKMTAAEIKLSDELRTYIEEAMRVPGDLNPTQVKQAADTFLKVVLPEIPRFVEQGFDINHRTITKYFGKHNEFLHRRMISGDLNIYVNDPGYLAWRTYRGKLMQAEWEPLRQGKVKQALQTMKNSLGGENNVPYLNVTRYLQELEGIPHESFAQIEDALIGAFERTGLTKYVAPTILRDMFQKMNMVTYKATIPFRPLLLLRNASEIYRIGGITGGRSLGHAITYVMSPETRLKAMAEARAAGALKPDLPVFTVDPSARTAIRGSVLRDIKGGRGVERVVQKAQQGAQMLDDAAEIGMGFYQRVDEYTRSIAYHAMQHRIRTNLGHARPGTWNKFIEKSKLSTFDKTEIAQFENLWQAGRTDEAIAYASTTFSDKTLFLYGNANHPVGWGSVYGVLFGQFGTWPIQYKDFLINGITRGTAKDRLEFAAWNFAAPALIIHEGKKIGIDLNSWWGVSSLAYSGGPYADASIDVIRAFSGNEAERAMARSNLRRMNPASTPVPNVVVPLSFALNDAYEILTGQRPPIELIVKTTRGRRQQ